MVQHISIPLRDVMICTCPHWDKGLLTKEVLNFPTRNRFSLSINEPVGLFDLLLAVLVIYTNIFLTFEVPWSPHLRDVILLDKTAGAWGPSK